MDSLQAVWTCRIDAGRLGEFDHGVDPVTTTEHERRVPLGRLGNPEGRAPVAKILATNLPGEFITIPGWRRAALQAERSSIVGRALALLWGWNVWNYARPIPGSSTSSARWQATKCPAVISRRAGGCARQTASA